MKIITWNVNNRVGTVSQQVQALAQREPDVVALQDVNLNAVTPYLEAFHLIGLSHAMHTLARQSHAIPTGVLIASCSPLSPLPDIPESVLWSQGVCSPDREKVRQHWTRRTLFALLHSPFGEIEVARKAALSLPQAGFALRRLPGTCHPGNSASSAVRRFQYATA